MELLLSVCLWATPGDCRDESVVVSVEPTGPMACMMTAPQTVAQWSEVHPKWHVMRWRCDPPGRAGQNI